MKASPVRIISAVKPRDVERAKELFLEYAASLGFDLDFQGFDEEVARLPGCYAPPSGRLLLAARGGESIGCVALRPLGTGVCEMKRLYVRPNRRGEGIGKMLAERIVREARRIGYETMRLDAIRDMHAAVRLYGSMGFREIAPYRFNPVEGAVYMELPLGIVKPQNKRPPR
jgi:ribosomal protein S18 acetylase RimI-like enzyme